jgi:CheY-like chemotaxis protein
MQIKATGELVGATGSGLRILLVEDHEDTLHLMVRLLQGSGHQVKTANSVATALSAAAAEKFEFVISDLGLPDGSGIELMQQLIAKGPAIKGIALTGSADDDAGQQCLEAGFLKHITKPVDILKLESLLQELR